jgi:hypothetical protein
MPKRYCCATGSAIADRTDERSKHKAKLLMWRVTRTACLKPVLPVVRPLFENIATGAKNYNNPDRNLDCLTPMWG